MDEMLWLHVAPARIQSDRGEQLVVLWDWEWAGYKNIEWKLVPKGGAALPRLS